MGYSEKYRKTNLFVVDEELWRWAKAQSILRGHASVSKYLFELINQQKKFQEDTSVTVVTGTVVERDGELYLKDPEFIRKVKNEKNEEKKTQ